MKNLRAAVLALSLCFLSTAAFAEQDITGVYHCNGGNYSGTTTISKLGNTYNLQWQIGNSTHYGVGLRNGNILSSCWVPNGGVAGIVVYEIQADGTLRGQYTSMGGGQVNVETLTKKY